MLHFLQGKDLFNQHENNEAIKNILAVLMIRVILADDEASLKEQKRVLDFYKREFKMDEEATLDLFNTIKYDDPELHASLEELQHILDHDKLIKAKVLEHINDVILCDGYTDVEYTVFEKIKAYLV